MDLIDGGITMQIVIILTVHIEKHGYLCAIYESRVILIIDMCDSLVMMCGHVLKNSKQSLRHSSDGVFHIYIFQAFF